MFVRLSDLLRSLLGRGGGGSGGVAVLTLHFSCFCSWLQLIVLDAPVSPRGGEENPIRMQTALLDS